MVKLSELNELVKELRNVCNAETVAQVRYNEHRQRRCRIERKIGRLIGDEAEAHAFLQLLKSQAGCQSDDDYVHSIDGDESLNYLRPSKPRAL